MKRSILSQCVAAFVLAIAVCPNAASAQDLTISGTFHMDELFPTVGDDLAEVYAAGNDNSWTLALYGVTYSYDWYHDEWEWLAPPGIVWSSGYDDASITSVHAAYFEFQFFGPDAGVLNEVIRGDDFWLDFSNVDEADSPDGVHTLYSTWQLSIAGSAGVSFSAGGNSDQLFFTDENGFPLVESQSLVSWGAIDDFRLENYGYLFSYPDAVAIISSAPQTPSPPTLRITDASVQEGDRGTTWLDLTVTLSSYPDHVVTVDYKTVDGTARNRKDYYGTSGTLHFGPDEISRTISVAIKGDRRRESDETFSVELFNPAGATIADGLATATIRNDD